MPSRHPAHPEPDPDSSWKSCDDEQPGVSIRPLSHAELRALLAHLGHDQDQPDAPRPAPPAARPVVAVRVRASVGRPGASAQAAYRCRRAAAWAAWVRTLPWRAAAAVAAGVTSWLLAAQVAPRRGGLAGIVVAVGLAWVLRFRPSSDALAWRQGAAGERRTARLLAPLERHGRAVLHDLAIPASAANIDHLIIGPGGVMVIDSKKYRGRLQLDQDGLLWHGHHLLISALRKVLWEADQANEVLGIADIQVNAIVAVHGASVPWGCLQADGVTIVPARPAGARPAAGAATHPWARAGGLAGRPSPAAVPRRGLTACTERLSTRDCYPRTCTASRCRCVERSALAQRRQAGNIVSVRTLRVA